MAPTSVERHGRRKLSEAFGVSRTGPFRTSLIGWIPSGEVVLRRQIGDEGAAAVSDMQDSAPPDVLHCLGEVLPQRCRQRGQHRAGRQKHIVHGKHVDRGGCMHEGGY